MSLHGRGRRSTERAQLLASMRCCGAGRPVERTPPREAGPFRPVVTRIPTARPPASACCACARADARAVRRRPGSRPIPRGGPGPARSVRSTEAGEEREGPRSGRVPWALRELREPRARPTSRGARGKAPRRRRRARGRASSGGGSEAERWGSGRTLRAARCAAGGGSTDPSGRGRRGRMPCRSACPSTAPLGSEATGTRPRWSRSSVRSPKRIRCRRSCCTREAQRTFPPARGPPTVEKHCVRAPTVGARATALGTGPARSGAERKDH